MKHFYCWAILLCVEHPMLGKVNMFFTSAETTWKNITKCGICQCCAVYRGRKKNLFSSSSPSVRLENDLAFWLTNLIRPLHQGDERQEAKILFLPPLSSSSALWWYFFNKKGRFARYPFLVWFNLCFFSRSPCEGMTRRYRSIVSGETSIGVHKASSRRLRSAVLYETQSDLNCSPFLSTAKLNTKLKHCPWSVRDLFFITSEKPE